MLEYFTSRMNLSDHDALENWANKYGGTAVFGFISTLLIAGKVLHHVFQFRGLIFGVLIIPPVVSLISVAATPTTYYHVCLGD